MNTTKMRLVISAFWMTAMVSQSLVPVCLARPLREPQVQEGTGGVPQRDILGPSRLLPARSSLLRQILVLKSTLQWRRPHVSCASRPENKT
jgi:hypothetical protein